MRKVLSFVAALCALSAQAAIPGDSLGNQYYRLFMPVTFYHQVATSQLALPGPSDDDAENAVNEALLNVYLNRPDLVETTETELQETGSVREDVTQPIVQQIDMTEHAAPMPDEPEVAPTDVVVTKPKFWTKKGDGFLQFMQNYVSGNWYKGGESFYSLMGNLTVEANYDNKSKWKWDNKLEAKLGFLTSRSDSLHKFKANEDLLRLTSKVGLQASKRWYYTLQFIGYTQFTRGLKSNDYHTFSDFMSPFNLNLGLGMDYKVELFDKRLTGAVNLSPIAVNYRYVARNWFEEGKWFPARYGIDADKHHLLDLGSQVTANIEWKLSDVVKWKSRLYAFTSFKRAEVEWENTFVLQVSKYITANIFVYPRFDDSNTRDDDLGYWQFKEYTSIGFNYSF